jgi:hypothetical protein
MIPIEYILKTKIWTEPRPIHTSQFPKRYKINSNTLTKTTPRNNVLTETDTAFYRNHKTRGKQKYKTRKQKKNTKKQKKTKNKTKRFSDV